MTLLRILFLFVVILAGCQGQAPVDPSYDHQTATYVAKTQPVEVNEQMSVTPFFSPDHSIDTETALVQSATSIIKLGIPGFDSWISCSWPTNTSYGCTPAVQRNESFPIFPALLNALHKGITVQILTNNYSQPYFPGLIDPLGFLALAGADIRSFTTVTFIHSKYISVDGKKAAVSSVNFSKTSFMKNREAGLLIENSTTILQFLDGVFDADFAQAVPWETIAYSASDMAIIKDTTPLPVIVPPMPTFNNSYVTPLTTVVGTVDMQAIASPDLAYETITDAMNSASDVQLYIYQITDDMCDYISNHTHMFYTILVSNEIYDKQDYYAAKACYTRLYNQGLTIRKTAEKVYTYSHQKFWIVDKKTVFLSTGNWGDTDYPNGSQVFPPYAPNSTTWRRTNRDFTIKIVNEDIVAIFQKVLDEDYSRGWDWWP
jgi:hypothetical protein